MKLLQGIAVDECAALLPGRLNGFFFKDDASIFRDLHDLRMGIPDGDAGTASRRFHRRFNEDTAADLTHFDPDFPCLYHGPCALGLFRAYALKALQPLLRIGPYGAERRGMEVSKLIGRRNAAGEGILIDSAVETQCHPPDDAGGMPSGRCDGESDRSGLGDSQGRAHILTDEFR